ncbi:MAG: hypothetical protein ACLFUW_00180 [Bacteroidales bacterium]
MAYGTRATFEPLREVASGSITGSYTALGSAIIDHARIVRIVNATNDQAYLSLDGSTDHIRMAANSFYLLDFSTNKVRDDGLFLPVGTTFYVKHTGSAPTSGNLWIEICYAAGGV